MSPQALFGRHFAIVGTTGGEKSYTVAKLLEEISKNNGKAIVIDATGEYETLKSDSKVKYVKFNDGKDSGYFHYSGLRETDLLALFRPAGQVQLPKLQEACKSLKIYQELISLGDKIQEEHKTWIQHNNSVRKEGKDRNAFLKLEKENSLIINSVICNFEILHLPHQVYFECIFETGTTGKFGTKHERDLGLCNSLISRTNSTLRNNSFINAFGIGKKGRNENDFVTIFENFIESDSKKILLILSVENVTSDSDLKAVLVNVIGRYLYEKALSADKCFKLSPLILMFDEAHQFLNKKVKDEYSLEIELNALEKIAKECRKQGLFLVVATQVPRDIPQGVLSQFGTFIVHRLINQRDREVIEYACSEATKSALSFLPILLLEKLF